MWKETHGFVRFQVIATTFSDIAPCSLTEIGRRFKAMIRFVALMMETVSTSETSVNFYESTRRSIPEGCLSSSLTGYLEFSWCF
jgi:hypothetical protein